VELAETIQQELVENPALEEAAEPETEKEIVDLMDFNEYLPPPFALENSIRIRSPGI
jgi:hypothetical protein